MSTSQIEDATEILTSQKTTYDDLTNLYEELRTDSAEVPSVRVSQRAVCQIVGELIDYLDFVGDNLEKSIGLPRTNELKRILNQIDKPTAEDPIIQASSLVEQWEYIDLYTGQNIEYIVEENTTTYE